MKKVIAVIIALFLLTLGLAAPAGAEVLEEPIDEVTPQCPTPFTLAPWEQYPTYVANYGPANFCFDSPELILIIACFKVPDTPTGTLPGRNNGKFDEKPDAHTDKNGNPKDSGGTQGHTTFNGNGYGHLPVPTKNVCIEPRPI